jgi:hypothetical protein
MNNKQHSLLTLPCGVHTVWYHRLSWGLKHRNTSSYYLLFFTQTVIPCCVSRSHINTSFNTNFHLFFSWQQMLLLAYFTIIWKNCRLTRIPNVRAPRTGRNVCVCARACGGGGHFTDLNETCYEHWATVRYHKVSFPLVPQLANLILREATTHT